MTAPLTSRCGRSSTSDGSGRNYSLFAGHRRLAMHGASSVAELYRNHAPALHRRCLGIVGNSDDARDLVQETFARYLAAGNRFADATPFAVLYRIATNASIDRLRRRKTASEDELDDNALPGAHADAGATADPNLTARRVDALHDLV